jgi:nucleoside-diphosphate-sugar epimerase
VSINFEVFKNSRVLVTGHTGFKGSWLVTWLASLGAVVAGLFNRHAFTWEAVNHYRFSLK